MDTYSIINNRLRNKIKGNDLQNVSMVKCELNESMENIQYLLELFKGRLKSSEILEINMLKLLMYNFQNIKKFYETKQK